MICYKDMTCYSLHHFENSKNVGWINIKNDFHRASLSEEFVSNLWEYIRYPLNVDRTSNDSVVVQYNKETKTLGFSEIRVISEDGLTKYAAPDLIFQYITQYSYCPPQEFIDAVLKGPKPTSPEYKYYISKYNEENLWGEDSKIVELSQNITNNIINNNNEYVSTLIQEKVDYINILTKDGSLLNASILNNNIGMAIQLLTMNIDVNKFSGIELISAILCQEDELIELLLGKNIMFNLSSPKTNPLFIATRKGNHKAVKLLLEHGIDPSIEYSNEFMRNFSVLDLAKKMNQGEIVSLLIS
ncbi:ankyrin repeat domain-containing protein [Paenibacillus woosongensis]|uniref:DUF7919 domain-containing protein n=1 Tax=Paenibacillus woosongensis TaxID=307580 RepID=A0ABQ4MV06_9BACL|nr:ankyrin repeat domain-containing protein [Paenibacillus woosongensis]GIP59740.1 hypothetical protein J15TS10_35540 [Paenibacillus woosongensis]